MKLSELMRSHDLTLDVKVHAGDNSVSVELKGVGFVQGPAALTKNYSGIFLLLSGHGDTFDDAVRDYGRQMKECREEKRYEMLIKGGKNGSRGKSLARIPDIDAF